jgi:hypothetical protein
MSTLQAGVLWKRYQRHTPAANIDATSPTDTASITPFCVSAPQVNSEVMPAAESPAINGVAKGIAQHTAQAPATPIAARTGFFKFMFSP